jgi:hypothetical protein
MGCRKTLVFPPIAQKDNRRAAADHIPQLDSPEQFFRLKRQLPLLRLRRLMRRAHYQSRPRR